MLHKFSYELLRKAVARKVVEVIVYLDDENRQEIARGELSKQNDSGLGDYRSIVKLGSEVQSRMLPYLETLVAKPESYNRVHRKMGVINLENTAVRNEFLNSVLMHVDENGLRGLNKLEGVRSICENFVIKECSSESISDETPTEEKWGIRDLEIEKIWDDGYTGKGVYIGHVDSGVSGDHEALAGKVEDFAVITPMGTPIESLPFDCMPNLHGTRTAGILVGGNKDDNCVGIAPDAKLVSAGILAGDSDAKLVSAVYSSGFSVDIAINWILAKERVKVLNMSFGTLGYTPQYDIIMDTVIKSGVVPVAAIGNVSQGATMRPANVPSVCAVGSYNSNGEVPENSGGAIFYLDGKQVIKPDLVAPGENIRTTTMENRTVSQYTPSYGTSIAAPHVTAAVALLVEACERNRVNAGVKEIMDAIFSTCAKKGIPPDHNDRYGRGYFRPYAALQKLLGRK